MTLTKYTLNYVKVEDFYFIPETDDGTPAILLFTAVGISQKMPIHIFGHLAEEWKLYIQVFTAPGMYLRYIDYYRNGCLTEIGF